LKRFFIYTQANPADALAYNYASTGSMQSVLPLQNRIIYQQKTAASLLFSRRVGKKYYELSDHLGNVTIIVNDRLKADATNNYANKAEVVSYTQYYAFGMAMPGRTKEDGYRYGFNGQEKCDEIAQGHTTAEYWEYDARLGRRWNIDPVYRAYTTPYIALGNNPIIFVDEKGNDWYIPEILQFADGTFWASELVWIDGNSDNIYGYNRITKPLELVSIDFENRELVVKQVNVFQINENVKNLKSILSQFKIPDIVIYGEGSIDNGGKRDPNSKVVIHEMEGELGDLFKITDAHTSKDRPTWIELLEAASDYFYNEERDKKIKVKHGYEYNYYEKSEHFYTDAKKVSHEVYYSPFEVEVGKPVKYYYFGERDKEGKLLPNGGKKNVPTNEKGVPTLDNSDEPWVIWH
jgi:RHS repeat-associated protein